jgi:hypothetical protein
MSEPIKNFPKYMLDNGLLFEINRRVLHPLGLSMVIDLDWTNKKKLAITALVQTEDYEGCLFDEEAFEVGESNYAKYLRKEGGRLEERKNKFGFVEQDKGNV